MKKIFTIIIGAIIVLLTCCKPQQDEIENLGVAPSNGLITVDDSNPHNPIFTANADGGFIYHWDFGNGDKKKGQKVTSYFPFTNNYTITCTIYGAGGSHVEATKVFKVASTDPAIANKKVWKELTGGGTGKTWVYNTDPKTGKPHYCFQTVNDLKTYPDNWKPSASWGQCVKITPDINGKMVFDLNGGTNYTYHQTAKDQGIKGSFILDTKLMTLTVKNPYILDFNIECTKPVYTSTGVYQIKKLTENEMVLWQYQTDSYIDKKGKKQLGTGWSWSFKKK